LAWCSELRSREGLVKRIIQYMYRTHREQHTEQTTRAASEQQHLRMYFSSLLPTQCLRCVLLLLAYSCQWPMSAFLSALSVHLYQIKNPFNYLSIPCNCVCVCVCVEGGKYKRVTHDTDTLSTFIHPYFFF